MQFAFLPKGITYMGNVEPIHIGGDGNNVAGFDFLFHGWQFVLGYIIIGACVDVFFYFTHTVYGISVGSKHGVFGGVGGHKPYLDGEGYAAYCLRFVFNNTHLLFVVNPVGEVV